MLRVHEFMPAALASAIRKAPLTPEKVAFAWRIAVGPAMDQATHIDLQGDVLHVRARHAAWAREVERSAAAIRTRLVPLLGEGAVRYLDVRSES